jgi:hypothetical protein
MILSHFRTGNPRRDPGSPGKKQREVGMKTKKEEYIDRVAKQLKEWSSGIDELESRVAKASSEVKAGYGALIKDTKKKRDALSHKLHELRETSGDA